nr:hypothetical protein [Motilibacter aurantiacus]
MTALDDRLVRLFDNPGTPWLVLAVALGVGALHAVAPGHGKSITAAYLVGSAGRYRHAAALGAIVAAMHTSSVLVLAIGWVALSEGTAVGTLALTEWLQVVAGAVFVVVGAALVWHRFRGSRGHGHSHTHEPHGRSHDHAHQPPGHGNEPHPHAHPHEPHGATATAVAVATQTEQHSHGHTHADPHSHSHGGRRHSHAPAPDVVPWSRKGLVALGLSGGLLPSPSAFMVLVSGILANRVPYAMLLIAAFAVGMALTLTAVGAASIRGTALLNEAGRSSGLAAALAVRLPSLAAVGVLLGGCVYLVRATAAVAA